MRLAIISMHTSPLEQAGTGDAGGMNVYIRNTAKELAKLGLEVDVYTRATRPLQGEVVQMSPGVQVINCVAGPYEGIPKSELPTQLAAFTGSIIAFARDNDLHYDLIHSHYWLSGQVAWLLRDLWNIRWVHTAHTLAAVKNTYLAPGDAREPESRRICEQQIVDNADLLIVNTEAEIADVEEGYDSHRARIAVVTPGTDIEQFTPGTDRASENARRALGIPLRAKVIGFVGRQQRLKGPDVLLKAAAKLIHENPGCMVSVVICGGVSGTESDRPHWLKELAEELGIAQEVRFLQPRPPEELNVVYQATDIVAMPSSNESFGLVALEAQATGTPVVAHRIGGLQLALDEGKTGVLVDDLEVDSWAEALGNLLCDDERRRAMAEYAPKYAARFSWKHTAEELVELYQSLPPMPVNGRTDRHPAG